MPVYLLDERPIFPPASHADAEGLLAVGGDLSVTRLLAAYRGGIFPWYDEPPILWWSPDPRLILEPEGLRVSKSLRKTLRQGRFEIRADTAFAAVVQACAETPRPGEDGTWITPDMQRAYLRLHEQGYAHCLETWRDGRLVGGIYGVGLGRVFFGESMFHRETNASKVALVALVDWLRAEGVDLIDCQVTSEHLLSLGAKEIPRALFLERLREATRFPTRRQPWTWPPSTTPEGRSEGFLRGDG